MKRRLAPSSRVVEAIGSRHLADLSTFTAGTEVLTGSGSLECLPSVVARLKMDRLAVVCDRGAASAGPLDSVCERLGSRRPAVQLLVTPDPSIADAERACAQAREAAADSVLVIGGGSGLALGKAVAVGLSIRRPLSAVTSRHGNDLPEPVPTIAIPTTAGSGSEVSSVFVLRDPDSPSAIVFRGRGYAPRVALLDGALLRSLPREPMIYAALDSLSHSLEALWARGANRFTDALALAAADQVYATLPRGLEERDPDSLQTLIEASAMANLACGSSGLGLVHALSLATAVRLPHGYQNGVLLPAVAAFNYPSVRQAVRTRIDRLQPLYERIGFGGRFRAGELDGAAVDAIAEVALASPLTANNVRSAERADLRGILEQAGAPVSESSLAQAHDSLSSGRRGGPMGA
jgi:alcohol dehydrogenase class IV